MKKKSKFKPQKARFAVTGYILMWALMMIVAVVFTQALRNSISFLFIIIAAVVPVFDLAYVFAARASVSVNFSCSTTQAQKHEPVTVKLTVKNKTIVPVPFTEVELILPDADGLHSIPAAVTASLSPLGSYVYDKSVVFPYKGEYACGVKNVYVSSLLRFFRFRIEADKSKSVLILPRRITIDDIPQRYVNETSAVSAPTKGADSAEITEIKEYVPGDPIRKIHWKLSTKAQELMTKHFGSENGLCTCVIADTGRFFAVPPEKKNDINEYCDDAVCELCCFAVSESLLKGRRTSLVYPDAKSGGIINKKTFEEKPSFEEYLPAYVCAGLSDPVPLSGLIESSDEGEENDLIFVTARLTDETVTELCAAQSVNRAVTLLLFEPLSRFENGAEIREKNTRYVNELLSANVNVRRIAENELAI